MRNPHKCSAQRSSRVWQVVGDIKRGCVQDQRRARCAIQCAMYLPAAPPTHLEVHVLALLRRRVAGEEAADHAVQLALQLTLCTKGAVQAEAVMAAGLFSDLIARLRVDHCLQYAMCIAAAVSTKCVSP